MYCDSYLNQSKIDFEIRFPYTASAYRYDFDKDGFIKKEDVRLVLSHIPIEKTIIGNI